ncbi:MAG: peptidylprolyl isomerase [Clostridiales bacterium]|nr:peptidylprolyl isomerase [Clostridiales bacterium]
MVSQDSANRTRALFTMENGETFTIELYPEYAPATCENFAKLVSEGFYNGLTFHRVVEGFMAQGGDPEGTGTGGSDETIYGEFSSNGFTKNTLSHTRGVVSMARSSDPNSASSQFFICYSDSDTFLDGNYAAFGKVIDGMETVDNFLKIERTYSGGELSSPVTPIVIKTAELIYD